MPLVNSTHCFLIVSFSLTKALNFLFLTLEATKDEDLEVCLGEDECIGLDEDGGVWIRGCCSKE